jgi:ADP-heptose:LPS heptosyltransferase
MNKKAKNIGRFKRLALRLLGPYLSKMVLSLRLRKKIDKSSIVLPSDTSRSSAFFIILPRDRTEMIFQLENLFSILGRYRDSKITFLCPAAHASFVIGLKTAAVIKYVPQELSIYNAQFNEIVNELSNRAFDICVNLEKQYDISLLYFIGLSRAHMRIGWEECGGTYPFLNLKIKSQQRPECNLWERNAELSKLLGAYTDSKVRWGVPKAAAEEAAALLSQRNLKKESALICIDVASLESGYGKQWCSELKEALKAQANVQFYVFGGLEEEAYDFANEKFAVMPPLSITRTAALIAYTELVITGQGALLGLAQISHCKIIPVLDREQYALYCKRNNRILPALFDKKPDGETIWQIVKNIKTLIASADVKQK